MTVFLRAILAFAFFLGLAFSSVTALAATKVNFSGFYKIFHENNVNFSRSVSNNNKDSQSFFWHRLQLVVDFAATENVNVRWVLRGPTAVRWGRVPTGRQGSRGDASTGYPYDVFTRAIYATVKTDFGKFNLGRHNSGMVGTLAGLDTLGYAPKYGDFLNNHVFDTNMTFDGITYQKKWDSGLGLNVIYVKETGFDQGYENEDKDVDKDRFGIEPFYLWDGGAASLNIEYSRDLSRFNNATIGGNVYPVEKNWAFSLNPALILKFGDLSFHFEGKAAWGETVFRRFSNTPTAPNLEANKAKDVGLGFYVDAVYKYGPGSVTLGGWYFDGNDPTDPNEGGAPSPTRKTGHGLVGAGSFSPFLVAYAGSGLIGPGTSVNNLGLTGSGSPARFGLNNHWALAIFGDHSVAKDVKVRYGLGYFRLVNPLGRHLIGLDGAGNPILADNSQDLGFEIDLGVITKLLDNVSFESHFGYFFNGSAFDQYNGTTAAKAKDTFAWANALIFTF
ncbi:MAG: hypothetical protein LBT86_08335 [Deltaproteobacteria bacterium]|jgi:hypothetical protein|nr:hypothetical protein [Deltaproteobacteria bacterium]